MPNYAGLKYSQDKNGVVNYVSLDGCYLNIENFKLLPLSQRERVYNWFHYMFTSEHKGARELEVMIHSLHIQEIIVLDPNRPHTDTVNYVIVLNKTDDDIINEKSDNKAGFSIVELLTEAVTTMQVANDQFVFAYNTLVRYGYIRDKEIAKRLAVVNNMINSNEYEEKPKPASKVAKRR